MANKFLITGGAGFIGSNYANRLINRGEEVVIYDNLSRPGTEKNLEWLYTKYGPGSFNLIQNDIRDVKSLQEAAKKVNVIVHLAGQVAVTTSILNPREDFEINALGTFNALEAARYADNNPFFLFASTNKVYGGMENLIVVEEKDTYRYQDFPEGISEQRNLDFHSPYGCSKGTGDQYVRDYSRIYGLPTLVFRQSCIYGPRQFGLEDQGWVAWFVIAALLGKPISIYGDGKQVRDLLFVEDLLDAYDAAIYAPEKSKGEVFNIGGGSENTMSVWNQFQPILEELLGRVVPVNFANWRPGDQRIYVSDIRKAEKLLNWHPKTSVKAGIEILFNWVKDNIFLFQDH